mmetsp:Transcript_29208/g.61124  ORF Transcript_29208/g.61124 Transcript_29208/m.61124 type:complete len:212 (-) Transcript_29208:755-1390(-)
MGCPCCQWSNMEHTILKSGPSIGAEAACGWVLPVVRLRPLLHPHWPAFLHLLHPRQYRLDTQSAKHPYLAPEWGTIERRTWVRDPITEQLPVERPRVGSFQHRGVDDITESCSTWSRLEPRIGDSSKYVKSTCPWSRAHRLRDPISCAHDLRICHLRRRHPRHRPVMHTPRLGRPRSVGVRQPWDSNRAFAPPTCKESCLLPPCARAPWQY